MITSISSQRKFCQKMPGTISRRPKRPTVGHGWPTIWHSPAWRANGTGTWKMGQGWGVGCVGWRIAMVNKGVSKNKRYPKMDGLWWKTLLKWMIWGYHYFWKHPYPVVYRVLYIPGGEPDFFYQQYYMIFTESYTPERLTWNIVMKVWFRSFSFQYKCVIFRFHVNLPGFKYHETGMLQQMVPGPPTFL